MRDKRRANRKAVPGLGESLRRIRKDSGVSIKAAAPRLGVDYTYLSKIENGYATPSSELLERLAKLYNVEGDELYAAAQKVPPDVAQILRDNLTEAVALLRRSFKRDGPAA